MSAESWAALAVVFILGAMSPGPSLALVLRNTMQGGRRQGVLTAVGHGIGFGVYAFSAALGFAAALAAHETAVQVLRWGGTVILVWLGAVFLRHAMGGSHDSHVEEGRGSDGRMAFAQGFFLAIFNPKILAWLLALYAPFIDADMTTETLLTMGLMGVCTDGGWYVTVALVLSGTGLIDRIRAKAHIIDGAVGVVMLGFAALLVTGVV